MIQKPTIKINKELKSELNHLGNKGDSYDGRIKNLEAGKLHRELK